MNINEKEGQWETLFLHWAKKLKFKPKNISLFKMAMTHSSYSKKMQPNSCMFESLEFLGDAVLGLAIAEYIYKANPDSSPGEFTLMRSSIVRSQSLSDVARDISLSDMILMSKGEENAGGRDKDSILEDAMEAFIGAFYLDQGWTRTKNFAYRIFETQLDRTLSFSIQKDSKSELQELCQEKHFPLPEYCVIKEEGPDHQKWFQVGIYINNKLISVGEGKSKKSASQMAAQKALSLLQKKG
ncbi:MAG TPA: ribonuclease III [Candidatus Hydrogenedens sp.]|nr:ribonuclease III [Candidatus Hydrogenedens sp.]